MTTPYILKNSTLPVSSTRYTREGQMLMAQVSTFEKREVISMV
ncbi:MAG TPA: hypothetical protein V6C84_17395 [Coleofasciculaceae cyanobacterium]